MCICVGNQCNKISNNKPTPSQGQHIVGFSTTITATANPFYIDFKMYTRSILELMLISMMLNVVNLFNIGSKPMQNPENQSWFLTNLIMKWVTYMNRATWYISLSTKYMLKVSHATCVFTRTDVESIFFFIKKLTCDFEFIVPNFIYVIMYLSFLYIVTYMLLVLGLIINKIIIRLKADKTKCLTSNLPQNKDKNHGQSRLKK